MELTKKQLAKILTDCVEVQLRKSFPVPVRNHIRDLLLERLVKEEKSLLEEFCSSLGVNF